MQGHVRNRAVVALETFMHYGRKGIPTPAESHKPCVTAVYRRVETASGHKVYLPANAKAAKDFKALNHDEKAALITTVPPTGRSGEPECESRRILAGSRFKALPRGKREGDVFVGDHIRAIYPKTTGSLVQVQSVRGRSPSILQPSRTERTIRALRLVHGLTEKEALWVMEQAELRKANALSKK